MSKDHVFPQPGNNPEGLTKLEYFAGIAMLGILANHENRLTHDHVAKDAVKQAKSLLRELNKVQNDSSK